MLLALCAIASGARAEEEWVEEEPRWIPSLRFGFDAFQYGTQATVQNLIDPPANSGTQNNSSRLLMLQLGGELLGPMLGDVPGHPRLFAQGGMQFKPFSSDEIFQIGVGANPQLEIESFWTRLATAKARFPNNPAAWPLEPDTFTGEGSDIDAQFQNLSWNGALGVAFTFPVADSLLLELRPSLAYNVDRIEMSGSIATVVQMGERLWPATPAAGGSLQIVPDLAVVRGEASDKITQHSLGPGLEVGVVLFRETRPVRASIYADARFLWLLGDRTTSFGDSVARYEVRRDPFEIRGGAGVRLSWVGFGGR